MVKTAAVLTCWTTLPRGTVRGFTWYTCLKLRCNLDLGNARKIRDPHFLYCNRLDSNYVYGVLHLRHFNFTNFLLWLNMITLKIPCFMLEINSMLSNLYQIARLYKIASKKLFCHIFKEFRTVTVGKIKLRFWNL